MMHVLLFAALPWSQDGLQIHRRYQFERLSIEQGLSHETVLDITQDQLGYMWFGTSLGLNRYDGQQVHTFEESTDVARALSQDVVNRIVCDPTGWIWAATFNHGLFRVDPRTLEAQHFAVAGLGEARISDMCTDRFGFLWLSTLKQGVFRIDPDSLNAERITISHTQPDQDVIVSFLYSDDANLIAGTQDRLFVYDRVTSQFEARDPFDLGPLNQERLCCMQSVGSGTYWVGLWNGGVRQFNGTGSLVHIPGLEEVEVYSLWVDRSSSLWVGAFQDGLYRVDGKTMEISRPLSSPIDANGLFGHSVTSIYEDHTGVMWFGTINQGIFRLDPQTLAFTNLSFSDPANREIEVTALGTADDGRIWLGTNESGLWVQRDGKDLHLAGQFLDISCLRVDHLNHVWVGSRSGEIRQIHANGQLLAEYSPGQQEKGSYRTYPTTIFEDSLNRLWVGTNRGLLKLAPNGGGFDKVELTTCSIHAEPHADPVGALGEVVKQWILLGCNYGEAIIIERDSGRQRRIRCVTNAFSNQFDVRVTSFTQAGPQEVWVGTFGEGIKRLDLVSERIQPITSQQQRIGGLFPDDHQSLWVIGELGLSKLNTETGLERLFRAHDGLVFKDFHHQAFIKREDGNLTFGSGSGWVSFPQTLSYTDPTPPYVHFTGLNLFGKPIQHSTPALNTPDGLSLSHRENTISFEFVGLHYASPGAISFEHRLEPLDHEWKSIEAGRQSLTYYKLPPGRYALSLRAANHHGLWSPATQLTFNIAPPFWKTWWAYLAYALMAITAVMLTLKKRTARLSRLATQLESEVKTRTIQILDQKNTIERLLARKEELFAAVSHEFRTPLTLVIGPIERLLATQTPFHAQLVLMRRNAKKLLRLVDQLLDLARLGEQTPEHAKTIQVASQMDFLIQSFLPIIEDRQQSIQREMDPAVHLRMPDDVFEKIFGNLLSNAVKYGGPGVVISIRVWVEDTDAMIQVCDNGPGIPASHQPHVFERFYRVDEGANQPGAGIGLALVKEMTEVYSGSIELTSSPQQGTSFVLRFPACDTHIGKSAAPMLQRSSLQLELDDLTAVTSTDLSGAAPHKEKPDILVIDDHVDMQRFIGESLAAIANCDYAGNGEQGLIKAQETIPDLVVCDLMMPGIDGFAVNSAIKNNPLTSHIPVIILTARGDRESRIRGLKDAADAYLTKPFNDTELRAHVESLIANRQALSVRFAGQLTQVTCADPNPTQVLGPLDEQFLTQLTETIEQHFQEPDFSAGTLVSHMNLSERPLQRKLKAITGLTPSQYLRNYRLEKAYEHLSKGLGPAEVAFKVGFSSHAYFSTCFREHYGKPPSQLLNQNGLDPAP